MVLFRAILAGLFCAVVLGAGADLFAQGVPSGAAAAQRGQPGMPQLENPSGNNTRDNSLVIAPRAGAPSPAAASTPAPDQSVSEPGALDNSPEQDLPPVPTSGPPPSMASSNPEPARPYLGIAVQRVESHATPGRDVEGLEIVSVDSDSPAQHAGLLGRGAMTSLGATGATAGALMAPLNLVFMPLLNKTGQLGETGDLIVAIDDRRVTGESDLETALDNSQAGDTLYFTIVRLGPDGSRKTLKIPVKLASSAPPSGGIASRGSHPQAEPPPAH